MNIQETFTISLQSLKSNRLRTLLTILGVVVGIFSIIVIMTVITMLQNSIESGLSELGNNTFQIQKYPAIMTGGPGARDKYRNRRDLTIEEFFQFEALLTQAKYVGAEQWQWGVVVKYGNIESNPNIQFAGVTDEAIYTNEWVIEEGRDFRKLDIQYGSRICILGKEVANLLFPNINPIGKTIRVDGNPLQVVGVLEPKQALFGMSRDNIVLTPLTTFMTFYGKYSRSINITVTTHSKEDYENTLEAAIGYMRQVRKIAPGKENDFDIYSNETLIGRINEMNEPIKIGAMVVSFIALLAAGVGIMNIMLVSVTERTKEIGIRKAIGAKKSSILLQFLFEAIMLCFLGGLIGIVIGVSIGNFAGSLINAQTAIPVDWVLIGIFLCVFVGIVFGTYPAYKAANLDPIEALRYE